MLIDFTPDKALYPFESHWFDSSAGRIHYMDEGSGIPILFCHGSPTWSFLYRKIVGELRDRFRCVAVDYPGFGLSERPPSYGYTIAEHATVIGELVDHLGLDQFVVMGQDWGGPVGTAVATERADRVRGLVLGNTLFWPAEAWTMKAFGRVMGSPPMQRQILRNNLIVERFLLGELRNKLSAAEADHYRKVQPSPEARRGIAVMPKQILAARPLLEQLATDVPARLGDKPTLLVWGMKDMAFRPAACLPRMRDTFTDHTVLHLPNARHYIPEHEPGEIAEAITERFL
ncbi:haloalkane dehalogenase [Streptomyces sp. NPDC000410]|uniref:haloalkane dehalogenase n=1 Tax=Streptomyces sp. NPDC000410 TaxID=3154254 RepID=UPI00331BC0ED